MNSALTDEQVALLWIECLRAPFFPPKFHLHNWQTIYSKHKILQPNKVNVLTRFSFVLSSSRELSPLRFIGLIVCSSAQTPFFFLKAPESSNCSSGGLILIWIQLIDCFFRLPLSQFPLLPSTLVKTFANFPRNQISAVWILTSC